MEGKLEGYNPPPLTLLPLFCLEFDSSHRYNGYPLEYDYQRSTQQQYTGDVNEGVTRDRGMHRTSHVTCHTSHVTRHTSHGILSQAKHWANTRVL